MIDTIVIGVNVKKAPGLLKSLIEKTTKKQRYGKVNRNSLEVSYGGNFYQVFNDFFKIKSSEYKVNWSYSDSEGLLRFNLSVPKYLYATNVIQFIVDRSDEEYDECKNKNILGNAEGVFRKLYQFVDKFREEILMGRVTMHDIQIMRIDICYNLILNDIQEVEDYYEAIKKARIKYLRQGSNKLKSYETSFMYIGKGYSFKVYKKGIEFRKNDYKELLKMENYKRIKNNVEYIKNLADRTIRYEMTIRKQLINRIYKKYIYRNKCREWNYYVKCLNEGKKIETKFRKLIISHLNRGHDFVFETISNEREVNEKFSKTFSKNAKFSKKLFTLLVNEFYNRAKEFTVTQVNKYDDAIKDLKVIKKINSIDYSLEEAYQLGIIGKTTYFKYKKILKERNISQCIVNLNIDNKFDYVTYHQEVMNNRMLVN